jgi:hypothetical protein
MPIIYAIYASPCHLPYYGSTVRTLAQRKGDHKYKYKSFKKGIKSVNCSAYRLFNEVGVEKCIFEIVEHLPDDFTKKQMLEREKFWIKNNICINEKQPIRTEEELKEYQHIYQKANLKKRKEYISTYSKANRAKLNEYQRRRNAEKKVEAKL